MFLISFSKGNENTASGELFPERFPKIVRLFSTGVVPKPFRSGRVARGLRSIGMEGMLQKNKVQK